MKLLALPLLLSLVFLLVRSKSFASPINFPPQAPHTNQHIKKDDDRNLKILSWNIYMLPPVVPQKGKRERAHAIVEELMHSDYDIIVFQEAFLTAARHIISKGLGTIYPYQYGPINRKPGLKISGGVWILSKIPMTPLKVIQFRDCATWDCMARKGAVLMEGVWNGRPFQLMGTHLQADQFQEVRFKQMDQIYTELLSPFNRPGVPQLICGDMNTEAEIKDRYCAMLDCFGAENGDISGVEKCTYDGVNNYIAQSFGVKNKTTYDYILVRNNGIKIKSVKRFVSVLKKGKKFLSDHYGIACEVAFE